MATTTTAPPFPRAPLIAAGAAIALSILAAVVGRMTGAADSTPTAPAVIARDLRFQDRPDGSVAVFDAHDMRRPIEMIAPETNGFLRATMRGLAGYRLHADKATETPFRLTEWADGRLTLEDPETGRRVEMEAFGATNAAAFARLLTTRAPK
jgi:putative photosynthetic complex assembly protein